MPYHDLLLVIYLPNVEDGGSNIDAIAFVRRRMRRALRYVSPSQVVLALLKVDTTNVVPSSSQTS
jgi:hypothetical protein